MKKYFVLIILVMVTCKFSQAQSFSPYGKQFGFGIMVGDPLGATLKFWTHDSHAFVVDVGASYFGSPRIGVDYLWHFNAFKSRIANLYAGPGGAIGVGEGNGFWYKGHYVRASGTVGIGARGVVGVNLVPEDTPIEVFFELGVLLALAPDFDSGIDVGLGIRFYP
ncbi:MAG TPA: hypothetical protein VLB50_07755 [Ignavibacteriaceae bacterium]|nr:hypothetical protein [Ignavibacteriaceae bacterium]